MFHEVEIEASPENIIEALTTEAGLKGWYTADCEAKPVVGSLATLGFLKRAVIFKMRMVELTPAKTVRWRCEGEWEEWIRTTLRFDLEPWSKGGARVRFKNMPGGFPRAACTPRATPPGVL